MRNNVRMITNGFKDNGNTTDVDEAYLRIKDVVKETPLQYDHYLSQNIIVMFI